MQEYAFISKCREIITVQVRKNTITGALVLTLLMVFLFPAVIYLSIKSDYVTFLLLGYASFFLVGLIAIAWYRTARLNWTHIDSRDMSRIMSSDAPISQDVMIHTKNTGNYTYGDLKHVLAGYERLAAAAEYTRTGVNKKFKVSGRKGGKWLRLALIPFKFVSMRFIVLLIVLAQSGVAAGVLPTVHELVTGTPLPSLSLHLSVREILVQIAVPRAITIGLLQALRILLTKHK
ncbi:hypothetical protein R5Q34_004568 [Salmonella enterica]|nr:hypothetical protein [Salmonella enterica]